MADFSKVAIKRYPDLNRKSFATTAIPDAPEHSSWKYFKNGKGYQVYLDKDKYRLRESAG